MNKFARCERIPMTEEQMIGIAKATGVSLEDVKAHIDYPDELYKNDVYQVSKRFIPSSDPTFPDSIHLSIRRLDREAIHDWRDLQLIKNELVGPEIEMWECYPKESLLVDTANQYHLWGCNTETKIIPWGFNSGRMVIDADEETMEKTNTKQRKL